MPLDEPVRLTDDVVPSAVVAVAADEPAAVASDPEVTRFAFAVTPPSPSKWALVALSAVDVSVEVSLPVAPAWVEAEESAVLPLASWLWPLALPLAEALAPAPSAVASECDDEPVAPPPAVELLVE